MTRQPGQGQTLPGFLKILFREFAWSDMMQRFCLVLLICLSLVVAGVEGFGKSLTRVNVLKTSRTALRDFKSDLEPTGDEPYGPFGSLVRQGPVPFFIRVVKPDTYDAAVKKYMLREGCDIRTAQANMDAYFEDPNGWAANKAKGKEIDYLNQNTGIQQLLLTAVWAVGITSLFYRIFAVQVLHQ